MKPFRNFIRFNCFVLSLIVAGALFGAEPSNETFKKIKDRSVDLTRDRNLYVVGYAHLDTQWRWTYPLVIREYLAKTLRDNFTLLEKYPNYLFNFSGSRRYEMMQEYYPDDFVTLKRYVAAGRWFPAGSSVDEADSIVPSGESLLRHVLYGNHYFRREFGVASEEFILPDCFGFPAALPSILAHAGLKGFSTQKLTWGSAVGIPFKVGVWVGPDGRSVVAALDPGKYGGKVTEDLSKNQSWLKRIETTGSISGAFVDYHYFGTGDKGGAPADDSVRWIERSLVSGGPVRVIPSTADQMFKDLQPGQIAKLPRYQGELLLTEHSTGSITSAAYMKRWNRKNELLADAAERVSVVAQWLGGAPYPAKKLYDAWDLVLGSQMHDMLPGTSHPKAYDYCWNDELLAANQFADVLEDAVGAVAALLDTRGDGVSLVVYNPLSFEREDIVEADVTLPERDSGALQAMGPDGRIVPAQVIARNGDKLKVIFCARVPSVGFAVYRLLPTTVAAPTESTLQVSQSALENDRYRVALDAHGDVASIIDKDNGQELLSAPARLAFLSERPLRWPAWNMDWTDRQKPPRAFVDGPAHVRIAEAGPVRVALEVEREAQGSCFIQTIRLGAGAAGDRVEFATRIDWQTPGSSLKASFPLSAANPLATYDSQLGTVMRGNNDSKKYEVPQHQWFDLTASDGSRGVAVLNDSKFGSDKPDDATLRLTLLYSPGVRTQYQDQAVQDFGRHDILYALTAHTGDWRKGNVVSQAARLNQPLRVFQSPSHAGVLGRSFSLFKLSSSQVAIQAIKQAEDSDEIIVRFRELGGQPAKGVVLSAAMPLATVREVDGQERPLASATLRNGELIFDQANYGLRSFALKLGAPTAKLDAPVSQSLALPYNEDVISTNSKRSDGRFDTAGFTYPAEQLPAKIVSDGIKFVTGPTVDGKLNAVSAHGQVIALPEGSFNRLYLLAAADGDTKARFLVDGRAVELTVQDWSGYIGQWDSREWQGNPPENVSNWTYTFSGLTPGFSKRDSVAWFCSHRHSPAGDEYYQYSYLFKYRIDLPANAKTLTLPDNSRVRILAATVARNAHDDVRAAAPLYDRLDDHAPDLPTITPAGGKFADSTTVTVTHPLYWHDGGLRYTLDGSDPTANSPVYTQPLQISGKVVLRVCQFDASDRPGPVAIAKYEVTDTTAPRVTAAVAIGAVPVVRVTFSERIERTSAESLVNYALNQKMSVVSATLSDDGVSVFMALSAPLEGATELTVRGVRDGSSAANILAKQTLMVEVENPVYRHPDLATGQSAEFKVPKLPVEKGQPWTMNLFVRTAVEPDNRTLIAGFGCADNKATGTGRYFAKFSNGVHLWLCNTTDVGSSTALAIGRWQMLTATYDGILLRLYADGKLINWLEIALEEDDAIVRLAPIDPWDKERRFKGEIRGFAVWDHVLSSEALKLIQTGEMPR